jgi:hypothetical protein
MRRRRPAGKVKGTNRCADRRIGAPAGRCALFSAAAGGEAPRHTFSAYAHYYEYPACMRCSHVAAAAPRAGNRCGRRGFRSRRLSSAARGTRLQPPGRFASACKKHFGAGPAALREQAARSDDSAEGPLQWPLRPAATAAADDCHRPPPSRERQEGEPSEDSLPPSHLAALSCRLSRSPCSTGARALTANHTGSKP